MSRNDASTPESGGDRTQRAAAAAAGEGSPRGGAGSHGGEDAGSPRAAASGDLDADVYPRSYPVPGRINLKRALRAYVRGHDRGWDAETKARLAEGEGPGYQGAGRAVEDAERTARPGAGAGGDAAEPPVPAEVPRAPGGEAPGAATRPRYGVRVPEELDFHRGPDVWRLELPSLGHARRPAGWSGRARPEEGAGGEEDRPGGEDRRGREEEG